MNNMYVKKKMKYINKYNFIVFQMLKYSNFNISNFVKQMYLLRNNDIFT